ncbi:MAG: serine/threonine-protein kinase [Persicimonas sp.]
MSKFRDIASFETHLHTLGIDAPTLQMDPSGTLRAEEEGARDRRRDALHTLPELVLAEGTLGNAPPDLDVIGTLGQGGMGVVRLANQLSLDREVAVKTTREETNEAAAQALLQEAYVTGFLEHPNIIPIYTVGRTEDGAPLIVMKRVEGISWLELIEDDSHSRAGELDKHLQILIQVSNAVRFAHSRGILHRDIKAENVMIGHFDEVYLLDWGIAVSLDEDKSLLPHRAQARGMSGTPSYMAPEMTVSSGEEIDELTDVYLLGATLHQVLTGQPRHTGESMLQVMFAAHQSRPHDYAQDVPAELAAIANRACHRDKQQRFGSVEAFRDALQDYLRHRESIVLSKSAQEKGVELAELLAADDIDPLDVHDTYGECRFGFYQALRMWPENPQAADGLQRCLEAMADYSLRQGNLDSARACIAELPEPRPELVERADELARQLDEEGEELARLKRLEHNLDLNTATSTRSLLAIIFGVLWTGTSLYAAVSIDAGDVTHAQELRNHMIAGFRNVGIVTVGVFAFRKRLFANEVNRRVVYMLVTMTLLVTFGRWSTWYLGEGLILSRAADSAMYVLALIGIGLMSDLRLSLLAIPFALAATVGVMWPETQVYGNSIATALTFGGLAWIWRPSGAGKKLTL